MRTQSLRVSREAQVRRGVKEEVKEQEIEFRMDDVMVDLSRHVEISTKGGFALGAMSVDMITQYQIQ
jgi:hypothetical protein